MEALWHAVESAWDGLIELSSLLVMPDWGALIGLLPVGILLGVIGFIAWIVVRYAGAAPTRRGPGRVPPRTPDSIHMPGPSFAPVFAAVGAFVFFFGLLLGTSSIGFWLGLVALVVTLLYWLREGMRDYDAIEAPAIVPAVVYAGPPPGVHMPGPSFHPLLVSSAAVVLFAGLLVGPALAVGGVVLLFVTLVGWLRDAGREYHETEATGHASGEHRPTYPLRTLAVFALVLAVGIGLSLGGGTGGETVPGENQQGGSTVDGGGASAEPSASPAVEADVVIVAKNVEFDLSEIRVAAGAAFTIAMVNEDAGVPHNVAIHKDSPTGEELFRGEIVPGPTTIVYEIPALDAGTYGFVCTVHPNMAGSLIAE